MLDGAVVDKRRLLASLSKSKLVIDELFKSDATQNNILSAITLVLNCFKDGNKLIFVGNGGSAADAQHMSAEYVSRFMFDRPALPSIALTTDTSALTAIGNDYGFDTIFSRQLHALGNAGDVLFAYSTSGTSPNVLQCLKVARDKGIKTIAMTGTKPDSQAMSDLCDITIGVPSQETPYIQEGHLIIGHLICLNVEASLFENKG